MLRIDGAVQLGRLEVIAVLDPLFWTDDEVDTDLVATWKRRCSGYGILFGWRPTAIGVAHGHQFQETLLVGAVGPLPRIGSLHVDWGIELGAVLAKHGGGLPTDVTSFSSASDIGDNLNASMFVRINYGRSL